MTTRELPIPPFVALATHNVWGYEPQQTELFNQALAWRDQHGITPSATDTRRIHLLEIDRQRDFCFPEGTLYVAGRSGTGAIDDNRRIAEFIYRNLGSITHITSTLDTHFAYQIFFSAFWVDEHDQPLQPFRTVTADDIRHRRARPNPAMAGWLVNGNYAWLERQVLFYCEELERGGKYALYLWPQHCLLGNAGHALVGIVQEARYVHAYARAVQTWSETKGSYALTENYSVLRPEVLARYDRGALAQKNAAFLKTLMEADAVVISGEASSHCVKNTIDDVLDELRATPELLRKIYILSDCMSAVVVPGADFTPEAEQALDAFRAAGMHVVVSTDPIESWPDFPR